MKIKHHSIEIGTGAEISIHEITPMICKYVKESGIQNGFVTVTSRHSTTALCINEYETLLLEDIRTFFEQLVPKNAKYRHNDLDLREGVPPGEPQNAHSHIAAILFGSSEVVHILEGELQLGTFQAVMMIELDGPKKRTVNLQIIGK